jgi:thymidylate kinase
MRTDYEPLSLSVCGRLLEGASGKRIRKISGEILDSDSWSSLQDRIKLPVLRNLAGGQNKYLLKSTWNTVVRTRMRASRFVARTILHRPPRRLGPGHMIAFVGIDGAGKTSIITKILRDGFFSRIGATRIYFGNNEFWFPCYERLEFLRNYPLLRTLWNTIRKFDRQMRLLPALYLKLAGNLVLCDRYYYDDEYAAACARSQAASQNLTGQIRARFRLFIRPRPLVDPDLTIFLDVKPEIAWKRKAEHELPVLERAAREFHTFMLKQKNVVVVDANRGAEEVMRDVSSAINKLLAKDNHK